MVAMRQFLESETRTEYKYDPVGRRIIRSLVDKVNSNKSNTKKYYYDGSNILAELDAENNLTASYTHSPLSADDILGAKFTSYAVSSGAISDGQELASSAGFVYYLKDHLNTVNDVVNSNGDIVQKMDYSAFGVLRSVKDSGGNEIGFENAPVRTSFTYTGREFEPELNIYYYRARYYDPSVGRFLQQDPDPGKLTDPRSFLSKYIYAANSPIMFSDPSGQIIWWVAWLAVAVISGLVQGGLNQNAARQGSQGNHSSTYFWDGFVAGFINGSLNYFAPGYSLLWNSIVAVGLNIQNQKRTASYDLNNPARNRLDFGSAFFAGVFSGAATYFGGAAFTSGFGAYFAPRIAEALGNTFGGFAGGFFAGGLTSSGISRSRNCDIDGCYNYSPPVGNGGN